MAVDPPWRLDPHETIVGVGWPRDKEPWWVWTPVNQEMQFSSENYPITFGEPHWEPAIWPETGFRWTNAYTPDPEMRWRRLPEIGHLYWVPPGDTYPPIPPYGYASLEQHALASPATLTKIDFKTPPTEYFEIAGLGGGWRPNIWQLTGYPQPFHLNPYSGEPVYDAPTGALAREVAKFYEAAWNSASDTFNAMMEGLSGTSSTAVHYYVGTRPFSVALNPSFAWIGWDFAIPRADGTAVVKGKLGNPWYATHRFDFCAGLPPAAYPPHTVINGVDYGYTISASQPAYASYIGVDQLDPDRWDTTGIIPVKKAGWTP